MTGVVLSIGSLQKMTKQIEHHEVFKEMMKEAKKERKKNRKKQWCPGCSYPYYGHECKRCGGE